MFEIELSICIKMDFALNNLYRLICHKIQPTNRLTKQADRHECVKFLLSPNASSLVLNLAYLQVQLLEPCARLCQLNSMDIYKSLY